jgi:hypothetical protein
VGPTSTFPRVTPLGPTQVFPRVSNRGPTRVFPRVVYGGPTPAYPWPAKAGPTWSEFGAIFWRYYLNGSVHFFHVYTPGITSLLFLVPACFHWIILPVPTQYSFTIPNSHSI